MKKMFLLVTVALILLTQASAQLATKKSYVIGTPSEISTVKIEGDLNVTLVVVSNEPNVWIQGGERFTSGIKTSIIDGTMTISARTASRSENDMVYVYASDLDLLELNGDIHLKTIGTINSAKTKLNVAGNCRLTVQHTGNLNVQLSEDCEFRDRQILRAKTL